VTELARRESIAFPAHEQWSGRFNTLGALALPLQQPLQFHPQGLWQYDLLKRRLLRRPFEDPQGHPATDFPFGVHHVADIQCHNLMLPQGRSQGQGNNDVVPQSPAVFTGDLEANVVRPRS
jgi:hypothetical protein